MIWASPVEQGTLPLSPGGWEIEAHTGLNHLLTSIKALGRSPVPSLLLRGLRHTQSKEEEEVTHDLLEVVQLPHLSLQSCPAVCAGAQGSTSASGGEDWKHKNSKAALQEKQGSFKSQRNLPEAPQVTVLICRTVLSPCSSSWFQGVTHQENHEIPIRVSVFTAGNHSWEKHSFKEKVLEGRSLMRHHRCWGFYGALEKASGSFDPGVCQVSHGCIQILRKPSAAISLEQKIIAELQRWLLS